MKIGVILGSIRTGRFGKGVADWIMDQVALREDEGVHFELIDLKEFNVPLLDVETVPGAANKHYADKNVTAWSHAIDSCDAFVLITAEYNHGVPGALKNAYDVLGGEWRGKPVGFVSYGAAQGIRAVEQWRQIVANFNQFDVRAQLSFSTFTDVRDGRFNPNERSSAELDNLLAALISAAKR
ncbi:NADPH-dependent FMN reductase [Corynebacterium pacaense]|uniref:NADPH-dependent FMN reductase n=1 Tax=Corynebacterium pacaense TaxID=1816684 RepID=UPI0009BC45AC|nr:NAD(P)H-dependent oxidoreductase [Corynebacterium pacaense]